MPEDAGTNSTQINLGGGEDNLEASTPEKWKPTNPSNVETITKTAKPSQKKLDTNSLILGSGICIGKSKSENVALENKISDTGPDKVSTKSKIQLERERLIAKIRQDRIFYQKRPRRKFLSPTTNEHGAAKYPNSWREKVELVGNANYPAKAKADGLSGSLIIDVAINQNGTINSIDILTPSPHKLLNDDAKQNDKLQNQ